MRKILLSAIMASFAFSSCNNAKKDNNVDENQNLPSREELAAAVADRDQLISLVNDINQGMEQIKQLENILTVTNNLPNENLTQREQVQNDIAAIQKALQERRERLEALEKKLGATSSENSNLRKTIASLRAQIDSQTAEIAQLKDNLGEAQVRIGLLDAAVDSLNNTVSVVSEERNIAQQESVELANELNTCYYAIGSKSELKERKIIETGFLRKTKLLKGDFDQSFFTTADKRILSRIALHSKKAEVLTNQPSGSYIINDDNGQKVLVITNPDAFWSLTNYLVIKID